MSALRSRSLPGLARILLLGILAGGPWSLTQAALAEDLPAFRKGLWEFSRTVESGGRKPMTMSVKKCTNPTDDMKKQNTMLTEAGCTFTPLTKSGSSYAFTSDCSVQGTDARSTSVISVESDVAYHVDVDSQQGGKKTKESLVARRLGDCP